MLFCIRLQTSVGILAFLGPKVVQKISSNEIFALVYFYHRCSKKGQQFFSSPKKVNKIL